MARKNRGHSKKGSGPPERPVPGTDSDAAHDDFDEADGGLSGDVLPPECDDDEEMAGDPLPPDDEDIEG